MEKYIVEFVSIFGDTLESQEKQYELEKASDLNIKPDFTRTKDYMAKTAIDLMKVSGYDEGTVYYNDQNLSCVYAEFTTEHGNYYSRNLLIKLSDFKLLIEFVNKLKVKSVSEIIHEIQLERVK